jgi:amino acid permease
MKKGGFFAVAAIVAAATVGDGIFALPYVFYQAGWLLGIFYLALLATFVGAAHVVYLKTLEKIGEKERLLGLTKHYLGTAGFWTGFIAIVVGLLLTLVAYLILGAQFVRLAFPGTPSPWTFFIFWLLISLPIFLGDRRVVELELAGIICTSGIIVLIFANAWPNVLFAGIPAVRPENLFLPFGAVLFSLAGWTSVEPAYESRKRRRAFSDPSRAIASGTIFVALLYTAFAAGILGSAPLISPDTVSGLAAWPAWKKEIIAIFGLLAVATVYLPVSREIKNALERDLGWNKFAARSLIMLAPLALVLLGLNNFLLVVGLVGGVFLSTQYLLIISVGRRALVLSTTKKFFLDLIAAVFILAAVYELWTFVVH